MKQILYDGMCLAAFVALILYGHPQAAIVPAVGFLCFQLNYCKGRRA